LQLGGVLGSAFKSKLCYLHVAPVGVQEQPTNVPHLPTASLLRLIPNPANPTARIDFSLAHPADVVLDIFDVRGRHIRNLFAGHLVAGDQAVVWNGLDDRGHGVESGVYFVHVRIGQQRHISKLTITR
jgi:hypothetical protein